MKLKTVNILSMDENCYLISTEKAAIIIDPGEMNDEIRSFIKESSGKETIILLTHNHFDHIMGADEARRLSGGKIVISKEDANGLLDAEYNLTERFCIPYTPFSADILVSDNDNLTVGDISVRVMSTPGHSKGSVCYFIGDCIFSGDTLFRLNVGRTDFIGGDRNQQIASIKRLFKIEGEYEIYSGHGPATRLSFEKKYNPYIE